LRQLLTESVLLGLLAGALGLPLAGWMLHLLIVEIASALPSFWGTIALQITPDIRIFAYTLFVSCAAGIAFGLFPAFQASKADVNSALKEEGSSFGQRLSRSRLRGLLIAAQMAACIVLLISSALLLRGSQRALKIDPGYESLRVAYMEMYNPANLHYSQQRLLQLNRDLIRGIETLPGVRSVSQASRGPIGGIRWARSGSSFTWAAVRFFYITFCVPFLNSFCRARRMTSCGAPPDGWREVWSKGCPSANSNFKTSVVKLFLRRASSSATISPPWTVCW
jgi:hypothetical protein